MPKKCHGGGSGMRDNQDILFEQLNLRKEDIEKSLERLVENQKEYHSQLSNDNLRDESDHAQREISVQSNYSLIEKKIRELKKIEHLIKKVSRDEGYGVCEECGDPIPTERLLIVPEASLCVECQRELERFAHSRDRAGGLRSAFTAEREREWVADGLEILEDDLMDFDFEIFPPVEAQKPKNEGAEKTA
jgi:DnaK suppressor protein